MAPLPLEAPAIAVASRMSASLCFVLTVVARLAQFSRMLQVNRAAVCWSTRLDVSLLPHRELSSQSSLRCAARPLCAPWSVPIAVVASSCCPIPRVILLTALGSFNVQERHSFACADIHSEHAAAARTRTSLFGDVPVEHLGAPPPLAVRRQPVESQWRVRLGCVSKHLRTCCGAACASSMSVSCMPMLGMRSRTKRKCPRTRYARASEIAVLYGSTGRSCEH